MNGMDGGRADLLYNENIETFQNSMPKRNVSCLPGKKNSPDIGRVKYSLATSEPMISYGS
jgi:hypothetical protein